MSGPKYGQPFRSTGIIGVCLNMIKGELSFALNGIYLGVAYKDYALRHGPMFASVSLLHKAGCLLVIGKELPPYFPR